MRIEFRVMSNKWEMEAEDMLVGKLAICLFLGKQVPVAIYSHENESFIPSLKIIQDNIDYKRSSVIKAQNSIKIIRNKKVSK